MKSAAGSGQKQYGITLTIKYVEFFQKPQQPQHFANTIAFLEDDDENTKPSKEPRITRKSPVEHFDISKWWSCIEDIEYNYWLYIYEYNQ